MRSVDQPLSSKTNRESEQGERGGNIPPRSPEIALVERRGTGAPTTSKTTRLVATSGERWGLPSSLQLSGNEMATIWLQPWSRRRTMRISVSSAKPVGSWGPTQEKLPSERCEANHKIATAMYPPAASDARHILGSDPSPARAEGRASRGRTWPPAAPRSSS